MNAYNLGQVIDFLMKALETALLTAKNLNDLQTKSVKR